MLCGMNSAIRLIRQGSWVTTSTVTPAVLLDGRPMFTVIGPTVLPVAPGMHRIDVHERYLGSSVPVAVMVMVAPGQLVDVFYAPPHTRFTSGRIGMVPQQRPGEATATAVYIVMGLMFALMLAMWMVIAVI